MPSVLELDERINKCRQILAQDSNSQIFAALAEAYRKKGDLERAYLICKKGLEIHPHYGSAHLVMAKIEMDKKNYVEAEKELLVATKLEGITRGSELLLAEILVKKKDFEKAEKILNKLTVADPYNESVKNLLEGVKKERQTSGSAVQTFVTPEAPQPVIKKGIRPSTPLKMELIQPPVSLDEPKIAKKFTAAEFLSLLRAFPGVWGALLVNQEGILLESKLPKELDSELLSAVSTEIYQCARLGSGKVNLGTMHSVLVENEMAKFWILQFQKNILVVYGSKEISLGSLKIRIGELSEKISLN